jgi:hypothetical protein
MPLKMFCVKGLADGTSADRYFGFAAVVIGAINIAATDAVKKLAGNNDALQTFVTEELAKEGLISETARKPTATDWLQFPLWIKVPIMKFPLSLSSRR